MSLLVDEDNDLWIGTQEGGLILRNENGDFSNLIQHPKYRSLQIPYGTFLKIAKTIFGLEQGNRDLYNLTKKEGRLRSLF